MSENTSIDKLQQQRQDKLEKYRELGVDPYGGKFEGVESAELLEVDLLMIKKARLLALPVVSFFCGILGN